MFFWSLSETKCAVIGWAGVWNRQGKKCVQSVDTWATQRNEKWKYGSDLGKYFKQVGDGWTWLMIMSDVGFGISWLLPLR